MKTLRETSIINDLLRQGRIFLDSNKLKKSDLTTDKLFMMADNDICSDKEFTDTYYKFEDEINNTLMDFRGL